MTPHKAGNRGTFIIDRRTRIGRIAVASGTKHAPTFRRLNEMITTLNETGRSDILRAIREGDLSPLAVYEHFRTNELHRLPLGKELSPLKTTMEAWLEAVECSTAQKAAHKTAVKRLGTGNLVDLPGNLAVVREECRKDRHPAQFNRLRSSALAFLRDTVKRSHRLYGEVRDIPLMKERKSPERHILSWSEVQTIAEKMVDARDRAAVYGMALTGMGPKEWYVDGWKLGDHAVTIFGAKRKSRARVVPAVFPERFAGPSVATDVGATREKRRFGERLLAASSVRPYDLRRTFANWLEAAGVTRTRRRLYRGHSRQEVGDIYEEHEVRAFLVEDARRIEAYLAPAPITSHITLSRKHLKRGGVT